MDKKVFTVYDEEIQEKPEETDFYFLTDHQDDITHLIVPLGYVFLSPREREQTILEIKEELKMTGIIQ